jgi:hypothetical protein
MGSSSWWVLSNQAQVLRGHTDWNVTCAQSTEGIYAGEGDRIESSRLYIAVPQGGRL